MKDEIVEFRAACLTVHFIDNERKFVRPTSSRWTVMIGGHEEVLDALTRTSPSEYTVIHSEGNVYLHSSSFDSVSEAVEMEAICRRILASINGALFLSTGAPATIHLRNITLHLGEDRYVRTIFAQDMQQVVRLPKSSLTAAANTAVSAWSDLAEHDVNVATVLRFLATERLDWPTQYKIFEVIRDDVGGAKRLVARGWMSKAKQSDFRRSANDPAVSGDDARHAKFKFQPLKSPMSRLEGELLIRELTQVWIASKSK